MFEDTQVKEKIIKELNDIGILVNEDGTIFYDKSERKMNIKAPYIVLLRHFDTMGTQNHEFMSDFSENSHVILSEKESVKKVFENYCKKEKIDVAIVCSNIPRVHETARLFQEVNPGIKFDYYAEYKGINNGGWEGKNIDSLEGEEKRIYIEREVKHNIFAKSSKGENWAQVLLNCKELINLINEKYYDKNILLIGQGSIARGINILTRKYREPWEKYNSKDMFNLDSNNRIERYGIVLKLNV